MTHNDEHCKKNALKLDEDIKSSIFFYFSLLTPSMSKTAIVM